MAEIYCRERPKLLRFVSARARSQDAEDIVHQAFARMMAAHPDAPVEAPSAYLHQTARRLVHDAARLHLRQSIDSHISVEEVAISGGDTVAHLESRDQLIRIEQALNRLKPLTREIFLARRLDGFGYKEIAERTGLSVKGVEKQMSRAIKQLSRHLRQHG
ncbi:RNA polymerase sigma factor [Novosphingobium sp. M1R2S20]|uniref:RNA polymerase sigma factor n=1 Tax=Novosphingobium rhizovicinum TaxID=3228928 RepID=A0ABV3REZ7_9SPHN